MKRLDIISHNWEYFPNLKKESQVPPLLDRQFFLKTQLRSLTRKMNEIILKKLTQSIVQILRPLIHILLKNGISFGTFSDIAKWVYVETASKEFGLDSRKPSISRASVLTGLSRKEVKRVKELPRPADTEVAEQYNRAVRVIAAWRREEDFSDQRGKPLILPLTGEGCTFAGLVKKFSGDLPFRAVLDELVNAGMVEKTADNTVRLLSRSYVPGEDQGIKFHILGTDVSNLISTIGHNLHADESQRLFQRKVSYDNLPREVLPVFHTMASRSAQRLLEKLDKYLAANDRDANPEVKGSGRHYAGLGIYYFEKPYDPRDDTWPE